ncbi:MAG: hypothetical protein V4543_09780 [Bacteroidota bacterium]
MRAKPQPEDYLLYILLAVVPFVFHTVSHFSVPYLSDDSLITLRSARNFSDGLGMVFNPGQFILANAGYLYIFIAGIYYTLFNPQAALHATVLSNILFHCITLVLIGRELVHLNPLALKRSAKISKWRAPAFRLAVLAGLCCLSLHVSPWVTGGDENQLFMLLTMYAFFKYTHGKQKFAVWLAMLSLWVNPAGILVYFVLLFSSIFTDQRLRLSLTVPVIALGLPWLLINYTCYNSLLPLSIDVARQTERMHLGNITNMLFSLMIGVKAGVAVLLPVILVPVLTIRFSPGLRSFAAFIALYLLLFMFSGVFMQTEQQAYIIVFGWWVLAVAGFAALTESLALSRLKTGPKTVVALLVTALAGLLFGKEAKHITGEVQPALAYRYEAGMAHAAEVSEILVRSGMKKKGRVLVSEIGSVAYFNEVSAKGEGLYNLLNYQNDIRLVQPDFVYSDYAGRTSALVQHVHALSGHSMAGTGIADDTQETALVLKKVRPAALVLSPVEYDANMKAGNLEHYSIAGISSVQELAESNKDIPGTSVPVEMYVMIRKK